MRKIPKVPFRILEAPAMQDDFYVDLLDWSSTNIIAVGLARAGLLCAHANTHEHAHKKTRAWISDTLARAAAHARAGP